MCVGGGSALNVHACTAGSRVASSALLLQLGAVTLLQVRCAGGRGHSAAVGRLGRTNRLGCEHH